MIPDFIIIGAQKSASTFVQACLAEHPEIYIPPGEISCFESPDYELKAFEDLEKLFEGHKGKKLGIKRPNYIGKPEVPERIKQHLPDVKLIAVLRNPIERAVSAYYHKINYGFIPAKDIKKGMELLQKGQYQQTFKRAQEIIEFGLYYKYLNKYRHYFEKNQILILLYDDIVANKLKSIQEIYAYIGVDSSYLPKALDLRPQAVIYSLPRLRFLAMRNSFVYNYNSDKTRLFPKKNNRAGKAIADIITALDRIVLSKVFTSEKPKLEIDLKDNLYKIYEEDIKKLEILIGRNLSHWKP